MLVFDPNLTTDCRHGDHTHPHPASKDFHLVALTPAAASTTPTTPTSWLKIDLSVEAEGFTGDLLRFAVVWDSVFFFVGFEDWVDTVGGLWRTILFCSVLIVPWSQLHTFLFSAVICSVLNWIRNLRLSVWDSSALVAFWLCVLAGVYPCACVYLFTYQSQSRYVQRPGLVGRRLRAQVHRYNRDRYRERVCVCFPCLNFDGNRQDGVCLPYLYLCLPLPFYCIRILQLLFESQSLNWSVPLCLF